MMVLFGIMIFLIEYMMLIVDFVCEVEDWGFEFLWVVEYIYILVLCKSFWLGGFDLLFFYYDVMDLFVSFVVVVLVIKMFKFVIGICLVVECDFIIMVKEVMIFDWVFNGWFLFGIGGGWNVEEMENYGIDYKICFSLMKDWIEVMKVIWI